MFFVSILVITRHREGVQTRYNGGKNTASLLELLKLSEPSNQPLILSYYRPKINIENSQLLTIQFKGLESVDGEKGPLRVFGHNS